MNSNAVAEHDVRDEGYVLVVDGITKSEHLVFVEAVKMGLELQQQSPHSVVKIRDASEAAYPVEEFPYLLAASLSR